MFRSMKSPNFDVTIIFDPKTKREYILLATKWNKQNKTELACGLQNDCYKTYLTVTNESKSVFSLGLVKKIGYFMDTQFSWSIFHWMNSLQKRLDSNEILLNPIWATDSTANINPLRLENR